MSFKPRNYRNDFQKNKKKQIKFLQIRVNLAVYTGNMCNVNTDI